MLLVYQLNMLCENDSHYSVCHLETVHTLGAMLSLAMVIVVSWSAGTFLPWPEYTVEHKRVWKAQSGSECFQSQNTYLGSACGSEQQHVGLRGRCGAKAGAGGPILGIQLMLLHMSVW